MKSEFSAVLAKVLVSIGLDATVAKVEYPEDSKNGDLTTSVALVCAKSAGLAPRTLAEKIVLELKKAAPAFIKDIQIAGPGFINAFIADVALAKSAIAPAVPVKKTGKKVIVEYTDPNTFKVFHIGHLMSNSIGESISRLLESGGTNVIRICYPSDIGLHIAKAVWALKNHIGEIPADDAPIAIRTGFLGKMYVEGTNAYDADPSAKSEIDALNKVLYDHSDSATDELYKKGRQWSLDHFEKLYATLGTNFDGMIFESDMAPVGLEIVKSHVKDGVFVESDGAIVFKGEEHGLHTRVFVNSHGIPTYEAKDVGLNVTKFAKYPDAEQSIVITASEQDDYFKVITKVLSLLDSKNGPKTKHIGHGMMRFAEGKMSSRKGNVITAESLISEMEDMVVDKMKGRELSKEETKEVAEIVAIGAIKYTILRSSIGSNIIFDSAASISFEGDSGPYLQYSAVRANSVLEKVRTTGNGFQGAPITIWPEKTGELERLLVRFDDVVARARVELAPQMIASYLVSLAASFNSFYAGNTILSDNEPLSPYRVALTRAFLHVMTEGLGLIGIKVPRKM